MTHLKLKRQGTGTNPTALVLKLGDPTKGNLRHTQYNIYSLISFREAVSVSSNIDLGFAEKVHGWREDRYLLFVIRDSLKRDRFLVRGNRELGEATEGRDVVGNVSRHLVFGESARFFQSERLIFLHFFSFLTIENPMK